MTDRSDDRPLSSEEMIKLARADLDRRPDLPAMERGTDQIRERIEEEMPSVDELVVAPRYAERPSAARPRTPRRVTRAARRPPAGFGEIPRRRSGNAVAIAAGLAMLVLGIAVFLAMAATGTG